ncbi:MAG: amidohydrolase family protein [Dehalococcoidia bacterium]|nr:amidohydrolase family protein [Dehalococcoidia bacterium]
MDLIIKNGLVVSPTGITRAAVAIDKGKIVAMGREDLMPSADRTIDAAGKHVLPGVCDLHCHEDLTPCPPHAPWSTIARTESEAAAVGGVTTMGFYLRQAADETTAGIFAGKKRDWEENAVGDCIFHSLVVHDQRMEEMPRNVSEFGITTFKFLSGYKGPQADKIGSVIVDDGFVFEGFQRIAQLRKQGRPALPLLHAENPDLIPYLRKKVEGRYDVRAWHDSRPNFVEAESMSRLIYLADVAGCPLYIVHVTIREGVDIIARARYEGKDVVGETCPQYLTHNHDNAPDLMRQKPVFTVVNPPIRGKEDNERLWEGIRDGIITVIGSDLTPIKARLKDVDMWSKGFVPMGLGPNHTMILPVMLSEGVNKRGISLERVVEVTSYNPARVFGLYPQKGTISPGSDADLVIVDMDKEVTWRQEMSPSNADWSIYEGWHFKGWPVLTMVRGKIVMEDGRIVADPGWGRYVHRK